VLARLPGEHFLHQPFERNRACQRVAIGFSGFFVQFVYGLLITAAVTVYALLHKRRD